MLKPTIVDFVTDPQLLGLTISPAQEALLCAAYGLPLDAAQLDLYRACTGRREYSGKPFSEIVCICGARGGKDSRTVTDICTGLMWQKNTADVNGDGRLR